MVNALKIDPDAWYDDDAVSKMLHITMQRLTVCCKRRGLRFSQRGSSRYFRGQWVIDWLEAGSISDLPKCEAASV